MKTILSLFAFLVFSGNVLFAQTASLTVTNATCNGACNGAVSSNTTGGSPPYTYLWSNNAVVPNPTGLCAGTYTLTVTDALGANGVFSATVAQPPLLYATISSQTSVTCFGGNDGTINAMASGGTAPYTYFWSTGATTPPIFGLVAGTYTVTVTDAQACTTTVSATITQPAALTATISSFTNVTCYGGNDGTATVTAIGGTSPYSYAWANAAITPTITNISIGTYTVTVTDANGCTAVVSATITQPVALTATITGMLNYCAGSSTTLDAGGGFISYSWSTGANTQITNATTANNPITVTVTDANGCTGTTSVNVTEITMPVANAGPDVAVCQLTNVMNAIPSVGVGTWTGTGPGTIVYFNTGNPTTTATVSVSGIYTFTWTENNNNGCIDQDTVVVQFTQPPTATFTAQTPICAGEPASIVYVGSGGVTYNWNFNGATILTGTLGTAGPFTITWNTANTYAVTLQVTDFNGCSSNTDTVLVTVNALAIVSGTVAYSVGDIPAGDGTVNLFKQSTSGGGQFDSIASQIITATGYNFNNLMPGNYHIGVTLTNPSAYPNLINTYYNNHFLWTDADTITLACNDNVTIPVLMYEFVSSPPGNCDLSGTIVYGNYSGFKNTKAVGEPVPGAEILIEQEPNDVPIQSAITDGNGDYLLTNIAEGFGYHLLVDIPGYPIMSTYLNLTINSTDTLLNNLNFLLDTSSGGGIFIDTVLGFSNPFVNSGIISMNVFPNPFAKYINVNFELSQNIDIVIDLISITGTESKELLNKPNCQKGNYNYKVSVPQNFAEGNYLIRIQAGNNLLVKKLILKN